MPAEFAAVSVGLKTSFLQGMGLRDTSIDDVAMTGVEELPNSSYIVYLDVRTGGVIREAAVWGHCVTPAQLALGPGGGFVSGPGDPEIDAQRAAFSEPCD